MNSLNIDDSKIFFLTVSRCVGGGGGGGMNGLVSYPDPNVRNEDHRLQYDITYRGSGT